MIATRHGANRGKERVGLPKRIIAAVAERAYTCGLPRTEAAGRLRRYLDALYHKGGAMLRVYTGRVWVYRGEVLITVLPLPVRYRTTAEEQMREREQIREAQRVA